MAAVAEATTAEATTAEATAAEAVAETTAAETASSSKKQQQQRKKKKKYHQTPNQLAITLLFTHALTDSRQTRIREAIVKCCLMSSDVS